MNTIYYVTNFMGILAGFLCVAMILDRANHVRKISLMGIGTSAGIYIDSKQLIRNALVNAFDRVIFVHNHPSNSINPSQEDKHLTDITGKLMEVFGIEMLDHIIVTEDNYASMK